MNSIDKRKKGMENDEFENENRLKKNMAYHECFVIIQPGYICSLAFQYRQTGWEQVRNNHPIFAMEIHAAV
jgi:hypothetical protein